VRPMDKFIFSFHPFAIDLGSLRWEKEWGYVEAVWFRRKNGVTSAQVGELRNMTRRVTDDPKVFLHEFTDGAYGGMCYGRWTGEKYWGSSQPEVMEQHLRILRPMLNGFHADRHNPWVPDNYDTWWTFRPRKGES